MAGWMDGRNEWIDVVVVGVLEMEVILEVAVEVVVVQVVSTLYQLSFNFESTLYDLNFIFVSTLYQS